MARIVTWVPRKAPYLGCNFTTNVTGWITQWDYFASIFQGQDPSWKASSNVTYLEWTFTAIVEGRARFKIRLTGDSRNTIAELNGASGRFFNVTRETDGWSAYGYGGWTIYPAVGKGRCYHAADNDEIIVEAYWKCQGASTSIVRVYVDGNLLMEKTNCDLGSTGMTGIRIGSNSTTPTNVHYAELIVEDANTEMGFFDTIRLVPSGAGNAAEMTPKPSGNNWGCVDKRLSEPDTYNLADAADEQDSYATENLPSAADSVQALMVGGVAHQNSAPGFTKAKALVRIGGSDYLSSAITIPAGLGQEFTNRWTQNPNTSAPWTVQNVADVEIGAKAVSS